MINRYTYTAREYDSETSLYYYRNRAYDSIIGRFIQKDPIGFGGGINIYSYAPNSINYTDPFGLFAAPLPPPSIPVPEPEIGPGQGLDKGEGECKKKKRCKPCIPPVDSIGYEVHISDVRGKHKGQPHVKLFKMNQAPEGTPLPGEECRCFWRYICTLNNTTTPPPGTVPLVPPAGGGVEYY